MKKHLSTFALAARGSFWRVLAVTLSAALLCGSHRRYRVTSGSDAQLAYIIGASSGRSLRRSSRLVSSSCVPAWRMVHPSMFRKYA